MKKIDEVYSFLPPIDRLLKIHKGIQNSQWIGLVGEPGAYKTVFTRWAIRKWLEYDSRCVVIYIATEENNRSIKKGLNSFGIDVNKYKNEGRLAIGSVFCYSEDGDEHVPDTPQGVAEFASKSVMNMAKKFGSMNKIRSMIVIDSMASFWSHAPAMSRQVWTKIYSYLFHKFDIGLMTFQLAGSTKKAFGWGAEHGVDAIFRFGKYVMDGNSGNRYFVIDKFRNEKEDGHVFISKIVNQEFQLGEKVPIKGKYASAYEAVEGLKYENDQDLKRESNELISDMRTSLSGILKFFKLLYNVFYNRKKRKEENTE